MTNTIVANFTFATNDASATFFLNATSFDADQVPLTDDTFARIRFALAMGGTVLIGRLAPIEISVVASPQMSLAEL